MSEVNTAIVGGAFALLVAMVTWLLSNARESQQQGRTRRLEIHAKLETLYVTELALLQKAIRLTHGREDYRPLHAEMADVSARMRLLSSPEILAQSELVSHLLYEWSCEYLAGTPKRLGDSGMVLIAAGDSEHTAKAQQLWN